MVDLTVQGTVDGALGSSYYTDAMSMVFTHGLEQLPLLPLYVGTQSREIGQKQPGIDHVHSFSLFFAQINVNFGSVKIR